MELTLKDSAATLIVATAKGEILKMRCTTSCWAAWMSSFGMTHRLLNGVIINYRNLLTQVSMKWCTNDVHQVQLGTKFFSRWRLAFHHSITRSKTATQKIFSNNTVYNCTFYHVIGRKSSCWMNHKNDYRG